MTVLIENTLVDYELDISELTEAELDGNGVFDVLLQTLRLHLDREFTGGRITGTAYATVYSQAITAFLQQSVQFCMSKAKLALELQQMKEQVKLLQLQQDQTIAQTNKITTDTVVAIKQGHLIDAQTCEVKARTNQINAEVATKLPEEVELIKRNQIKVTADTALVTQQRTNLVAEALNIPKQGVVLDKQADKLVADTLNQEKQTELLEFDLTQLKPKELELKTAQVGIAEQELLIKEKQVAITEYELTTKLPAEVLSTTNQAALYAQKVITEKAQAENAPATGSVMAIQNGLLTQQTQSYLRDAEQKAASMLIDSWSVRHNAEPTDNDADSQNKLADVYIGNAVQKMLTGIGA